MGQDPSVSCPWAFVRYPKTEDDHRHRGQQEAVNHGDVEKPQDEAIVRIRNPGLVTFDVSNQVRRLRRAASALTPLSLQTFLPAVFLDTSGD